MVDGFKGKDPKIQECLDQLAIMMFGVRTSTALNKGVCVKCKEYINPKNIRNTLEQDEYKISGLCGNCADMEDE